MQQSKQVKRCGSIPHPPYYSPRYPGKKIVLFEISPLAIPLSLNLSFHLLEKTQRKREKYYYSLLLYMHDLITVAVEELTTVFIRIGNIIRHVARISRHMPPFLSIMAVPKWMGSGKEGGGREGGGLEACSPE